MSNNNEKLNNYNEIYEKYPDLIDILLLDRTRESTKQAIPSSLISKERRNEAQYNIIWATDSYKDKNPLSPIYNGKDLDRLVPRCDKAKEEQLKRTKDKAEVFTPSWICNKQNNSIDNQRFLEAGIYTQEEIDKNGIFNKEISITNQITVKDKQIETITHSWDTNENPIKFNDKLTWLSYIKENVLEITAGENPYGTSRYDTVTGDVIEIKRRIGLLDRKLRVINENTKTKEEWLENVIIAYKHTYAYEWQGDNLFLARKNSLNTFIDYYFDRFNEYPTKEELTEIATIISWNLWQMDGLKGTIPMSCPTEFTKRKPKKEEIDELVALGKSLQEAKETLIDEPNCNGCKLSPIEGIRMSVNDTYNAQIRKNITNSKKQNWDNEGRLGHNGILTKIMNWEDNNIEYFIQSLYTKEESEASNVKTKSTKESKLSGFFKKVKN